MAGEAASLPSSHLEQLEDVVAAEASSQLEQLKDVGEVAAEAGEAREAKQLQFVAVKLNHLVTNLVAVVENT